MSRQRFLALAVLPLVVTALVFVAVVESQPGTPLLRRAIPDEPFVAARCTWRCHNRGCRHTPWLPPLLTSDAGWFGGTLRLFHRMGDALSPRDHGVGYGAANLIVFVVAWPALMYGLYLIALWQRARL
jgi:hypothetical protein